MGVNRNSMTQFSCIRSSIFHEHFGGKSLSKTKKSFKGSGSRCFCCIVLLGCKEAVSIPERVLTEGAVGLMTVVNCPR